MQIVGPTAVGKLKVGARVLNSRTFLRDRITIPLLHVATPLSRGVVRMYGWLYFGCYWLCVVPFTVDFVMFVYMWLFEYL
jgi:hypothetical protein